MSPCQPSFGSPSARAKTCSRAAIAAACTAGPTLATVCDPPESGACGRCESPSATATRDGASPSSSAAICAITVYVPVPISCVPEPTQAVPSALICTVALAAWRLTG